MPKTLKKRVSRPSKTKLKQEADRLFSLSIRSRGKCQRCGRATSLQCAHIVSRNNHHLRWDSRNALCLCYGCHIQFWHRNPLEAISWFQTTFPTEYKYLMAEKDILQTSLDYGNIIDKLKQYDKP